MLLNKKGFGSGQGGKLGTFPEIIWNMVSNLSVSGHEIAFNCSWKCKSVLLTFF